MQTCCQFHRYSIPWHHRQQPCEGECKTLTDILTPTAHSSATISFSMASNSLKHPGMTWMPAVSAGCACVQAGPSSRSSPPVMSLHGSACVCGWWSNSRWQEIQSVLLTSDHKRNEGMHSKFLFSIFRLLFTSQIWQFFFRVHWISFIHFHIESCKQLIGTWKSSSPVTIKVTQRQKCGTGVRGERPNLPLLSVGCHRQSKQSSRIQNGRNHTTGSGPGAPGSYSILLSSCFF